MAENKKQTQSEIDGVQYRRAKTWQIILQACNAFVGMGVYSLIGMASYAGNLGFGVTTVAIDVILMATRIFDGITDPMLAFVYDRVNTRFGKLRILPDNNYFIKVFRREYGMTPSEYRAHSFVRKSPLQEPSEKESSV